MITPVGNRLVVTELTSSERADLGFPPGTSGALDVGVVMAKGDDVDLDVEVGDRVFHRCQAPKIGAESHIVDGDCIVAFERKG